MDSETITLVTVWMKDLMGKTTGAGRMRIVQVRKDGGLNYCQENGQVRADL